MKSTVIKEAFLKYGLKVRVKDLKNGGFRICTIDGSAHGESSQLAASSIGMTNSGGIPGGNINQSHEMFSYRPGKFVRI